MRIEKDENGLDNQYSDEGKWLYQDQSENYRYFTNVVLLGNGEEPWPECTEQERQEWELSQNQSEETNELINE